MTDSARSLAFDALKRIEADGAYANIVLSTMLDRGALSEVDRRFATDLVYGTTRMRRACDALVDRFVVKPPDASTRTLLRLGAYQLEFAKVPPHAAVGETVAIAPKRVRGFVNAVLRKVAATPMIWPSENSRVSYPDWIAETLIHELGESDAMTTMRRMNEPPPVTKRADGYVQDLSSQWVAAAVEAQVGERILDTCAAPGGKATAMAAAGAAVIAADVRASRLGLIRDNATALSLEIETVEADATDPPFDSESFDAVLVDAPCSGLGALRRRADARWRIQPSDVSNLVELQSKILSASASLVRPGGRLIYSVCTLTSAESIGHALPDGFEIDSTEPSVGTWRAYGHGWRVLPQDADTDGMTLIRLRRTA